MIKTCHKCGVEVPRDIEKHFTAEDGRILCDKCSIGEEPCSERTKKILIEYEEENE